MARKKKARGRPPVRLLPPRADATAEELVRAFFKGKPGDEADFPMVYHCAGCKRVVSFPEILYRDKLCEDCTSYPVR
jgi:hypothetical protein